MSTTIGSKAPAALPKTAETAPPQAASPVPAEELGKAPLFRHIDFFDANKDGKLTVTEIAHGLERLGLGTVQSNLVAFATVAVRGPATTGHLKLEIDINNAMKSEQAGSTHLFNADGTVDMAKVEGVIKDLNPTGKAQLTIDDFAAYGKKLAEERVPGNDLIAHAKRGLQEAEFKVAWSGIFTIAGHDGADGKKTLTNDDVRWFYDGSLFYRRAAELEAAGKK